MDRCDCCIYTYLFIRISFLFFVISTGRFGEFSTLDNFNKASFILGFENWNRDDFKALLKLVKSFVLLIWETRKKELYGDQDCVVSGCSCSCPLTGGLTSSACVCGCVVNGVSATAAT